MGGGFGFRRAHRIVMAGEWHLVVTWASRKAEKAAIPRGERERKGAALARGILFISLVISRPANAVQLFS